MDAFKLFPSDVFLSYVLPKCSIDARCAFGLQPGRLDMAPYETGALGDAFRRRYRERTIHKTNELYDLTPHVTATLTVVRVPLWGMDLTLRPNSYFEDLRLPVTMCPVHLVIQREFNTDMSRKIPGGYLMRIGIIDDRYPLNDSAMRRRGCGFFGITADGRLTRYEKSLAGMTEC